MTRRCRESPAKWYSRLTLRCRRGTTASMPALVEEHIGPLREALGLSQESLLGLGRENPNNGDELFCMTVLALRLSRRANAVSALHAEVSRAMWTGLFQDKLEDDVPIGHITNGVHVPSWLAPQMFRLYDRHLGTELAPAQQRSEDLAGHRQRRRRRTLGNAPQPEVAADRICAPPGRGPGRAPRRIAGRAAAPGARAESRRADHWIRAAFRDLQAGQSDPDGHREAGFDGE